MKNMKFKNIIPYVLPFVLALPLSAETKKSIKSNYEVKQSTYTVAKSTPIAISALKKTEVVKKKSPEKIKNIDNYNSELYFSVGQSMLNPTEYNNAIRQVSLGDVYGSASNAGLGFSKKLGKLWLTVDTSQNSQRVNAVKKDISGNNVVYGYNQLANIDIDFMLGYDFNIFKGLSARVGAGLAVTRARLDSANEIETKYSLSTIYGSKIAFSLCQKLNDYFIRAEVAQRTGSQDNLDVSGLEAKLIVGVRRK